MEDSSVQNNVTFKTEPSPKKESDLKIKIIRSLGSLFIILGIAGLLLPYVNNFLIRKNQMDFKYNQVTKEQMQANMKKAEMFPVDQIREIGHFDFWGDLGKADISKVVGELHIPRLDIHLPIFSDSSNANLLAGVGMMQPAQKMGEGNYLLSGHRPNAKNALLHEVMDIRFGNTIYLTDKDQIYVYSVREAKKYPTNAVFMLEERQVDKYDNKPILTLMTCYNGKTDSRWFVVATLVNVLPYDPEILNNEYSVNFEDYEKESVGDQESSADNLTNTNSN